MDPELEALLKRYRTAGATDDQIMQVAAQWKQQHASQPVPVPQPTIQPVPQSAPEQPSLLSRTANSLLTSNPTPTGLIGSFVASAADHVRKYGAGPEAVNAAQGLPGGKAAEAFALAQSRGIPYSQAVQQVADYTAPLPTSDRVIGRMIGGAPLALIPGNPAVVGAGVAALDQLADADPNLGIKQRVARAIPAAAAGGLLGKLFEAAGTAVEAEGAPSRAENLIQREANEKATVGPMYDKALSKAQGLFQSSPEIQRTMQLPTLNNAAREIRANDDLMSIPPGNSPELFHNVYTGQSDTQTELENQILGLSKGPKTANEARRALQNTKDLKDVMLDAADQSGVPEYRDAAQAAAQAAAEQQAVKRGYSTMQNVAAPSEGGVNQVELTAPGLKRWVSGQSPDSPYVPSDAERLGAAEGVRAKIQEAPKFARVPLVRFPLPYPSSTLSEAPNLLRTLGQQANADLLAKLGLMSLAGAANR